MSYCRWSSNNWQCDVYVYDDVAGGLTTHVAARRRIVPPIPDIPWEWIPRFGAVWDNEQCQAVYPTRCHEWAAKIAFRLFSLWHRYVHMATVHLIPLKNIGMDYDGHSFYSEDVDTCLDRLRLLDAMGYKIPKQALLDIETEADAQRTGDEP